MTLVIEYAPDGMVYGSWRCRTCGCGFYNGGPAIHRTGCKDRDKDYETCSFVANPEVIKDAIQRGETKIGPYHGVTLADMRKQIPDQIAAIEAAAG